MTLENFNVSKEEVAHLILALFQAITSAKAKKIIEVLTHTLVVTSSKKP